MTTLKTRLVVVAQHRPKLKRALRPQIGIALLETERPMVNTIGSKGIAVRSPGIGRDRPIAFHPFTKMNVSIEVNGPPRHQPVHGNSTDVIHVERGEGRWAYNLYLNKLASQVTDGWVLILDDDSVLVNDTFIECFILIF